ncbi:hypothetical protein M407DRAFT_30644 [Tulasnella calospora MUT 4182]|uniref:Uncharacterized protein n=1 Tax=Tulasnella calospora MUT 4182 TaxID=1051891 RepID=A0A0C3LE27_9AGAM|nr:hypothetical protein M407DRAFT_30644 [Tulasnella calospora MUT 4182]
MPGVRRAFRQHTLIFTSIVHGARDAEEIFATYLDSFNIVPRPVVLETWRYRDNKQHVMILFPNPQKAKRAYERRNWVYHELHWLMRERRSFSPQENRKRNKAIDTLIEMHKSQGTPFPVTG